MMSGNNSPTAHITVSASSRSFYGESPPKRSRLHETNINNDLRPAFKSLKANIITFDTKSSDSIHGPNLRDNKHQAQPDVVGEEPGALDRDSPLPLKNLGNTCYENSIIQCLFSLDMFMANFKYSMKNIRRFVVKPTTKLEIGPRELNNRSQFNNFRHNDDDDANANANAEHDDENENENQNENGNGNNHIDIDRLKSEKQQQQIASSDTKTIFEDDVRFRIADAFDNLYRSYTHRRIQIARDNQNQENSDINCLHDNHSATSLSTSETSNVTSHTGTSVISLRKLEHSDNQLFSTENQSTPSNLEASSSLTPIALVSSAPASHEQSEIETRLEELKSAVGERSSQFNSTHQQDASEFFYHVIDSIQEFYQSLDNSKDDDNPVTRAFELELDYSVRCPKCDHQDNLETGKVRTLHLALPQGISDDSTNKDSFNPEATEAPTPPNSDLGLDSPRHESSDEHRNSSDEKENQALVNNDSNQSHINATKSNNSTSIVKLSSSEHQNFESSLNQTKRFTLCDALDNYFKQDVLDYSCAQKDCDSKQRIKRCLIKKLPQVLFITLARYSYTGKKNLDEIEAPLKLRVPFDEYKSPCHKPSSDSSTGDSDTDYRLVAAVCHLGSSLYAGHYTSYVYNQNNSSWYSCDDDSITKVQETDVKNDASRNGYCFFYARKSCLNIKNQSLMQDKLECTLKKQPQVTVKDSVSNIAINSSVVMTPESSPQSSPSPISKSNGITDMSETDPHTRCANDCEDIDDWS